MEQEDLRWRQHANVDWLKFGDKNTKFLHACASQRRKASKIDNIIDEQGRLWSTQKEVEEAFVD